MAATDQLGTQGNPLTQSAQATLVGSTQAGDKVTLLNTHQATVANTAGAFQFGNVALQEGVNNLAVQITDAAGNTSQFALSVTRIAASATGNAAIQWNQVILNAIETDASTPEYASRALAIESIAVMNAVNALNGTPGYLYNLTAPADANANAAVAQAAHDVLAWLYPAQASTFDAVLASTLSAIPNGQAKTDGISLGSASAAKIIALRANDGYNTNIVDTGGTGVGIWQPTGPGFAPAQDPQWANLQTFALNSPNQFTSTLPGPPSLTSQAYADALNQTESLGAANSTTRTADQTQIAKFWSDGQGTYTPPGAWNAIADQAAESQGYSLAATAQLLGELNIAMADSAIAAWNVKYTDNTWRPITAIQNAHSIGNSAITQNSSWQPLLITPNFPEYVSGHSTFSAAAAEVLTSFFGANYAFSTTSSSLPGVTRSYTSFWDAANEAGMSRIYGGIHFSFSNTDGLTLGTEVGEYVLKVFSQTQDTTPPKIEINQPSGFATNANPTITGTVTDNLSGVAALGYTLDGGKAIAVSFNNDGSFQLPLNLALDGSADGQHTLVFTATDATGNATAPFTFNFTLATQKPAISLDGNSIQNNGALAAGAQISGTVTDKAAITGLSYQFDNGTVMPIAFSAGGTTNTASFSQALNLSTLGTGSHTLTLTVTDAAGNSSTQTLNLTQPALALPTITSLTPMNGDTDVGVTQRPHIQFSRAIDPSTLTASTFYATDSTGAVIPATLVMQQDNLGAWLFFTNPLPGASTVTLHVLGSQIKALSDGTLLDAAGTGTAGTDYTETFTTVSTAAVPNTTLSGIIVDPGPDNTPMTPDDVKAGANGLSDYANDTWKLPIAGVKVYILGLESQAVTTNAQGQFTLTNVPTGDVKVVIDGTTATNAPSGFYFPTMTMDTTIKAGIANTMMGSMGTTQQQANANDPAVYLPRVNTSVLQTVNNNDTTVIKTLPVAASYLTPDQQQVLQVTVTPGSLIGHDGQAVQSAQIGISTVPVSLIESMLPAGLTGVKAAMTLQAPGVEKFSTPLTATFPNIYNSAPGSQVNFFSYDHATGKLVLDGTATVSADGKTVTTDPGSGIKFPGWFFVAPPGGTPQVPVNQPTKPNCDLTQIFFDGVSLSSAGASLALSAGELAAGIIAPEIVLPFVISKVVLDGTSTGLSVVSTIHQWNSNSFDENARNLVDLANGVLGQLPGWGIPSGILGFSKAFDDLYNDYKKCLTNQNTSMSQAMNSVSSMQAPQFQYTAALDFFNQFLNQQATATTELSNAINQVFGSAIQQFVPTTSQNVTLSMDSSSFVFLDSNGKTIQKSDGTGDFTVSIADLVNAVNQNDPNVKTGLLNMSVALQDMGNAYKSLSSGQQYFANIQSDYANFISMEQAGSIPSPIKLGAETRYAIFDAQTGNAVYRGLLNNNQLGTFLGANTLYTVEVYDPTSNSYGFSTLQTGVSGSSGYLLNGVANGSIQMFVNNGSTPVLTDGLTAFAANVIGVDGTKADNLVPGMTDLAALQAGLLGKSQIASLTGVVSSVSLQGNAQAIALEGNSNNIAEQTALVATSQGLSIVDVSNYQSPTVLGQIQLSGTGNDVAVDSTLGLATVAMGSGGLAIVDVSKPQQPTLTQTVAINASHVQIKDGIAYASVGTSIDAIDLATGQILQTIQVDPSRTIDSLAIDGTNLYALVNGGYSSHGVYKYTIGDSLSLVTGLDVTGHPTFGSMYMKVGGGNIYIGAADNNNSQQIPGIEIIQDLGSSLNLVGAPSAITAFDLALNGSGLAVYLGAAAASPFSSGEKLGVLNVTDPTKTGQLVTTIDLGGGEPWAVQIASGLAFIADGSAGLKIVNYRSFDTKGVAPTISNIQGPVDTDPNTSGIQVIEGSTVSLSATITDDVQVRNVQLLVNGQVVSNNVSYPWDLSVVMPSIAANGSNQVTLQIRATDTGGNVTTSAPITVQLVKDTTPPVLVNTNLQENDVRGQSYQSFIFTFNKPLGPTTVNASTFALIGPDGKSVTPVSVELRSNGKTVEVTYNSLALGQFKFEMDTGHIMDTVGNTMGTSIVTTDFTVKAYSDVWTNPNGGDWNDAATAFLISTSYL